MDAEGGEFHQFNLVSWFNAFALTFRLWTNVYLYFQVSTEEVNFQRRLRALLEPLGSSLRLVDSKPMTDPRDLPFDISDTPDLYTTFRKVRSGFTSIVSSKSAS